MTTCEADLIRHAAMAAALRLCHQRALAEEITWGEFLLAWRASCSSA